MLTEYQGQVFNVEEMGDYVRLWKYYPAVGFDEKETYRGIKYYEKTISRSHVSPFFSIMFYGVIEERRYVVSNLNGNQVDVFCDDAIYAREHGFVELDRGVWLGRKPLDSFSGFVMVRQEEDTCERTIKYISCENFAIAWKNYVSEVKL